MKRTFQTVTADLKKLKRNKHIPRNGHLNAATEQQPETLAVLKASVTSHFPLVKLYVILMY